MRESGEPMEFGIFNFPMCFQGLLVKGVMRQRGLRMEAGRDEIVMHLGFRFAMSGASRWMLVNNLDHSYFVLA